MPELPEVETVKESLKPLITNKTITDISIFYDGINEDDLNQIIGQKIINVSRYGKILIVELTNNFLLIHLRMEGKFYLKAKNDQIEKHEHVEFILDDKYSLRYHDTRKFGKMYLRNKDNLFSTKPLSILGKEPFTIKKDEFYQKLNNKNIPIKLALLDQTIIAGIGNIYADEILFLSKVLPTRKCSSITKEEADSIVDNAIITLNKAIKLGGTTIHSYNALGINGKFQNELLVHMQKGKPCVVCKTIIEKIKVGGRGTYVCYTCQK